MLIASLAIAASALAASATVPGDAGTDPTREEVEAVFAGIVTDLIRDNAPIVACAKNDISIGSAWYLCFAQARYDGDGDFVTLRGVPDRGAYDDPNLNAPGAWRWDIKDIETGAVLASTHDPDETTLGDLTLSACLLGLPEEEVRRIAERDDLDADFAVALYRGLINTGECATGGE